MVPYIEAPGATRCHRGRQVPNGHITADARDENDVRQRFADDDISPLVGRKGSSTREGGAPVW
jgi:hypothetical protein